MRLIAFLLLCTVPALGDTLTKKQYTKEMQQIYKATSKDIATYNRPDISPDKTALYVLKVNWDLYLFHIALTKFKHGFITQVELESYLSQLNYDLENAPE